MSLSHSHRVSRNLTREIPRIERFEEKERNSREIEILETIIKFIKYVVGFRCYKQKLKT